MIRCKICNAECDGKLAIGDLRYDGGDFIVCMECLNQYANHEFDKLTKKVEANPEYKNITRI